jgi:hypothetical protein
MTDEVSPEVLMRAASKEVDRLVKRSRQDRIVQIVLVVFIVVLAGLAWLSLDTISKVNDESNQLRQAALQSCQASNTSKALDEQNWYSFITLAVANSKDRNAASRIVKPFLDRVAREDAPRPCSSLFGP